MFSMLVSFAGAATDPTAGHLGPVIDRLISFGLDHGPFTWPFFPYFIVPYI